MANPENEELLLLLEDYDRALGRRLEKARKVALTPTYRPIWLQVEDFGRRARWQRARLPLMAPSLVTEGPGPRFDTAGFDPVRRYRETAKTGSWPPDQYTELRLQADWEKHRFHVWTFQTRGVSLAVHSVIFALLLMPRAMQLDLTEPADWDAMRITLMAPPMDDLPPLHGLDRVPGGGEEGFRGLPEPALESPPGPEPIPEPAPEPEEEQPETAEIPQPVETEPEEPTEEPVALEEAEAAEEVETPPAQSPAPGPFRQGRELANRQDPRLLPMPRAPSRKRAALQLEDPKARMPSRQGMAQLGTLELVARPDQVVQGAIQQMIRGGGPRQAVGTGIGGIRPSGGLPTQPAESGSLVELLSDPRGVDFRPYLTQVLAAVRRNWMAVIPESARLGMTRGRTLIQFSVARNGTVPKLVIARSSGTAPLDRAAVAGISASNPFPPLPNEYLGGDIRLQFTFLYNIRNP